jgi:hypothetical protein
MVELLGIKNINDLMGRYVLCINSNIKYARNMLITLPINALNNKRKTINGKPIHKEGLS